MSTIPQEGLEDIEDIASNGIDLVGTREGTGGAVRSRLRRKRKQPEEDQEEEEPDQDGDNLSASPCAPSSFVPGSASVHVRTWGCAHNSSDGEYMSGMLASQGYRLTDDKAKADLWLLNSCTVKSPSEDHFRNEVDAARRLGKKVVAAGCVSQGRPSADYLDGVSIVGVQQIDRVVDVVEETLKGNVVRLLGARRRPQGEAEGDGRKAGGAPLSLPKVRRNPLIEIIAISTGCLNQCTYCKTKHARGDLGSYPPEEIVARAEQSFREGVVEIWLTSEDTGAYGRDIGTNLPELLWKIVEVIPEGCRLRLGMTNPPYILDHLDEVASVLRHPRVYSFLHVPVQSGSDAVLRDMRREYNVDEFSRVVNILRKKVPGLTIATDIICGFPTETEQDFEETMILCRKYKFPSLFINQFFPRPGTPAAKMGVRVPTKEVKRRTRVLSEFFNSYRPYDSRIGQRYEVLVTETAHDGKHYVGHNQFYEQVLVPKDEALMGKVVEVEVESASKFSMSGAPAGERKARSPTSRRALKKGAVSGGGGGGGKKKQKDSQAMTASSQWMYRVSIVVLGLAIAIRVVQVLYMHFLKGAAGVGGGGGGGGGGGSGSLGAGNSANK